MGVKYVNCCQDCLINMLCSGAALGMVVAQYSQPIILIIYVYARKLHKKTWDGKLLSYWPPIMNLAVYKFAALECTIL